MAHLEIRIPSALRVYSRGAASLAVDASTVSEALGKWAVGHESLQRRFFGNDGRLRESVSLFLNDVQLLSADRASTPVHDGDRLEIVPSIAGGSGTPPETKLGAAEASTLTPNRLRRYSRHLLLPEVGLAGQRRMQHARVLIVGLGGLGSPAALYLAAAGVGTIGIVEFDRVDVSNLQRQVLYATSDIDQPKLERGAARLRELNPEITVLTHPGPLRAENALDIIGQYDVVLDGSDNFPTRYLVNDACVLLGKPDVYGSVYRFEGQATVFDGRTGPCYRCLFPEPPPPGSVPTCAEGGVLGVLPGLVGEIQATEALKLVLGIGRSLVGRLLLIDALELEFRELSVRKRPECPICGTHPTIRALVDYPAFCGVAAPGSEESAVVVPSITAEALAVRLKADPRPLLIDVRLPGEWEIGHLEGACLIPRAELPERVGELTSAAEIVVYCKSGVRSALAVRMLRDLGFTRVVQLEGGLNAWVERIDPTIPVY
ncbi:MAG: molybdopterin-synthase adenylyltransferase MoeB [Thermoplasmata archaeon]|nr:molybdopterin-synthase adenylyltransferase MoeB [Thermoplasmata archaeon]